MDEGPRFIEIFLHPQGRAVLNVRAILHARYDCPTHAVIQMEDGQTFMMVRESWEFLCQRQLGAPAWPAD